MAILFVSLYIIAKLATLFVALCIVVELATLLHQPGSAKIAPDRLSQIASHCDLGSLAALTLEKVLQGHNDEQEPQVKRQKENPGEGKKSMTWLHLSDVFKTVGDKHSVVGKKQKKGNKR